MSAHQILWALSLFCTATTSTLQQLVRNLFFRRVAIFTSSATIGASNAAVAEFCFFKAWMACRIISVEYIGAAITAHDTDYRTLLVSRRDAAGANKTTVATRATTVAGTAPAALVAYTITNSATPAALELAANEILTFEASDDGTAPVLGAGSLVVTYDLANL